MAERITRGDALVGGLHVGDSAFVGNDLSVTDAFTSASVAIGGGTLVKQIKIGTGTIDLASIAAGATGSGTIAVTGVAVGDTILVQSPVITAGLVLTGAIVTGANTVTVYFLNTTVAPIDEAVQTFRYLWLDIT